MECGRSRREGRGSARPRACSGRWIAGQPVGHVARSRATTPQPWMIAAETAPGPGPLARTDSRSPSLRPGRSRLSSILDGRSRRARDGPVTAPAVTPHGCVGGATIDVDRRRRAPRRGVYTGRPWRAGLARVSLFARRRRSFPR